MALNVIISRNRYDLPRPGEAETDPDPGVLRVLGAIGRFVGRVRDGLPLSCGINDAVSMTTTMHSEQHAKETQTHTHTHVKTCAYTHTPTTMTTK